MLQSNRDLGVGWVQKPCIREAEVLCGSDIEIETEAPVVVRGRAYIETLLVAWGTQTQGTTWTH